MSAEKTESQTGKCELEKHAAPSSAGGFLFQFQRAVQVLSMAPNEMTLGIETLDDLAIESPSGATILEQDKFTSNQTGNVFGDRTRNLLGSLSTWLAALLSGEISPDTTRFLLVTNIVCHDGFVRRISDATTDDDAKNCLREIQDITGKSKVSQRLIELLNKPNGTELFISLCKSVELVDGEETSAAFAKKALPLPSPMEAHRDVVFDALCGWIHSQALESWASGRPCRIAKQSFTNQLHAILDGLKRWKRRELPEHDIHLSDEDVASQKDATFVRQVELVTDDEGWKTDAIHDYLRCITEKTRLNKEGEITEKDWLDFSNRLERRWSNIWSRNNRLVKESEEDTGFRTMAEVLGEDYHPVLAGEPTVQCYLANGTYHRLSDEKTIGWHPRYRELLDEGDPNGHPV